MKDSEEGEKDCHVIHPKSQALLNKISLYSPEVLMPLIRASIAQRTPANYAEIIHPTPFCVRQTNASLECVGSK